MTRITSFFQRYPVGIFCTLTILLSFGAYLLPLPREVVPFVMVLVPATIGILMAAITDGYQGVRSLLGQLTRWKISLKWLAIALATALVMRLVISLVALVLGLIPSLQMRPMTLGEVGLLGLIFIVAAIPEELGWRGFALPRLLKSHTWWSAGLIIGFFWGLVHLALHLPGMPSEGQPGILTVLQLIGLSVLITWIFIQGGNNIILTSIFHAAQSFFVIFNEGITLSQQVWLMAGVWCAAALVIMALSRSSQFSISPKWG